MRVFLFALMLSALAGLLGLEVASAHDGVPIDEDQCKIKVGPFSIHFVGYQPAESGTKELCRAVPTTGNTIFVMDLIEPALRSKNIAVALYKGSGEEAADQKLSEIPAHVYSAGFLRLDEDLTEEGRYLVEVAVVDPATGQQYTGRMPIRVGGLILSTAYLLVGAISLLIFGAVGAYLYGVSREKRIGHRSGNA